MAKPQSDHRCDPPLALGWALCCLVPLLFGGLGVWAGKDAGWDVQNYHWYNAYAFLTDRFALDLAAAQHGSYYNPTLDVPLYLAAQHLSAWMVGFLLSVVQGLNFPLLFWLAWALGASLAPWPRLGLAALLSLAGVAGGGSLMLVGDGSYDNITSLGVMAAALVLARYHHKMRLGPWPQAGAWAALAGALVGAMVGLKLTTASYALGLGVAVVLLPGSWPRRLWLGLAFALGAGLGLLLFAGHWMYRLWQFSGNPFFPYFNDLFHSPLLACDSHRDTTFQPRTALMRWLFPLYFSFDSFLVAEWYFRDLRVLALAMTLIVAGLWGGLERLRGTRPVARPWLVPSAGRVVVVTCVVAYLAWLGMFCIYRYLVPVEMLAPLGIAAAIGWTPLSTRAKTALLVAILLTTEAMVSVNYVKRKPWGEAYVSAQAPAIDLSERPMILMTGRAPLSFVIPFFPPSIPWVRIESWLVPIDDQQTGLAQRLRQRVAEHDGRFLVIFDPKEPGSQGPGLALAAHGLSYDAGTCVEVPSNISPPLTLCRVQRSAPE